MANDLTVRENWLIRFLRRIRAVEPVVTDEHDAGIDFGQNYGATPTYPAIASMSALAAFPYVYAGVDVISSDMASLPLVASRKVRGGEPERLPDHPALELLERPNSDQSGVTFRTQLWVDFVLTGNAFYRKLRDRGGQGDPVSLVRLHPERVKIHTDRTGLVCGYTYENGGSGIELAPEDVAHVRGPSWEQGPRGLFGTGSILPLKDDLEADQSLQRANRTNFDAGRPTLVASPANEDVRLKKEDVDRASQILNERLTSNRGGAVVLSGAFNLEDLGWSPKDMEGLMQRDWVRRAIMAVLHCPPVLMGLETANYSTAAIQQEVYWTVQRRKAKLFDDIFTDLAKELGTPFDMIRHSFADVSALQEDQSERLRRVESAVLLGMDPNEAMAWQGFDDAPELQVFGGAEVGTESDTEFDTGVAAVPGGADKAQAAQAIIQSVAAGELPRETGVQMLNQFFNIPIDQANALMGPVGNSFFAAQPGDSLEDPPQSQASAQDRSVITLHDWLRRSDTDPDAAKRIADLRHWRQFEKDVRGPEERKTAIVLRRFWRDQAERMAKRAIRELSGSRAVHERNVIATIIAAILNSDEERQSLESAARRQIRRMMRRSFEATGQRLNVRVDWDDEIADRSGVVDDLAANLQGTTNDRIAALVRQGLDEGLTPQEIAEEIRRSSAFSVNRALGAARSETTKAVNAGAVESMRQAEEEHGLTIGKRWLTAGDENVRDAHKALGARAPIPVGDDFTINGDTAKAPGGFSDISLNANCRCTIEPVILEQA